MKKKSAFGLAIALAALSGCATTSSSRPVDVTRFHLGAPLEHGSVVIEPQSRNAATSLEFQTYANAVQGQLLSNGFTTPVGSAAAQYLAVISFSRTAQDVGPARSPVSIGLGGGGFSGGRRGGGVGLGGGVSFPIGKPKSRAIVTSELGVQIRRRSDGTVIWEGRAQTSADVRAPEAQADAAAAENVARLVPGLSRRFGPHYHGKMSITVNAAFDGGNIEVVGIEGDIVDLRIRRDQDSDFYQWFYFRVAGIGAGADGRTLTFRIVNAGESAYPMGWAGYQVRASTDRLAWPMTATRYADGVLEWDWTGDSQLVWFAYFAPYTMEQHEALVARIAAQPGVTHRELGQSIDGQAIDYLTIGNGPKPVWLYARQHPGESMAEWWMEGALERLTDAADPVTQALRTKATFHIVPNMNPDGTRRGHLRTNVVGVNLNREWHEPTPERSPEVLCVRDAMDATGVVFAMDVHGDEAIPANFFAGFEGIPNWSDAQGEKFTDFARRLAAHTPEFQTQQGYGKSAPGKANLTMSTNQVANRFGALAFTLEMPFKDHDPNPDAEFGWSAERSKQLAHRCLEVLAEVINNL